MRALHLAKRPALRGPNNVVFATAASSVPSSPSYEATSREAVDHFVEELPRYHDSLGVRDIIFILFEKPARSPALPTARPRPPPPPPPRPAAAARVLASPSTSSLPPQQSQLLPDRDAGIRRSSAHANSFVVVKPEHAEVRGSSAPSAQSQ